MYLSKFASDLLLEEGFVLTFKHKLQHEKYDMKTPKQNCL